MRSGRSIFLAFGFAVGLLAGLAPLGRAQEGKLLIRAKPSQAYVFVDGVPVGDASGSGFKQLIVTGLTPGAHKIGIYNYGYQPETRSVEITARKTTPLAVELQPLPGSVSGPWGRLQIEGAPRAAVLLNGKTPDFLVGHADEFDHDIIWKQELLLPPGTHLITLLRRLTGEEIYSGSVTIKPNQRVILYVNRNGQQVTKDWPRGARLGSVPRFKAGLASATVAVAPSSGGFTASRATIGCGESVQLAWKTNGMQSAEISGIGSVPTSGEQTVQPKDTTTYKFHASGTGGVEDSSVTVAVDKTIAASLNLTPAEVRYHRVGDKEEAGTAELSWTTSNASSVSIEGLGTVGSSGSQSVPVKAKRSGLGPVDETATYTLTATNACGETQTKTASLHIVGSVERALESTVTETTLATKLSLNSVYFPTAMPTPKEPVGGLVTSQQATLTELAGNFKKYLEFRPEAHLILEAHADKRGSPKYNQALTERRANRVKSFLTEQGVPDGDIETKAFGDVKNLDEKEVRKLLDNDPTVSAADKKKIVRNLRTIVLANNRRVDVVLSTTGQQSARLYPYNAPDSRELLAEARGKKGPAKAKKTPAPRKKK